MQLRMGKGVRVKRHAFQLLLHGKLDDNNQKACQTTLNTCQPLRVSKKHEQKLRMNETKKSSCKGHN